MVEELASTPPGPVVVVAARGVEFAVAVLGALALDRPVVPVGATVVPEAVRGLIAVTGARVVVHGDGGSTDFEWGLTRVDPARVRSGSLDRPEGPSSTFALIPTSGSTGAPKIVRVLEGSILEALEVAGRRFGDADPGPEDVIGTFLAPASFSVHGLFQGLVLGSPNVNVNPRVVPPPAIVRVLQERRVSYLRVVPSVLRQLVRAVPEGQHFDDLRVVHCSAEPLLWSDVSSARTVLPAHAMIQNRVGMTESGQFTIREVPGGEPVGVGAVPAGRIAPGRRVSIEQEPGVESPPGEEGEIVVEGEFLRIAPQAEPLGGGRFRLRTGDLGRIDESGDLVLVGRLDRMVKIAGVRVEPSAIEDALRGVVGILDAYVASVDRGGGARRLVAFVVVERWTYTLCA
jgi:acyl-coenzyme A synthetase/AMP-(fatty) acid ligase